MTVKAIYENGLFRPVKPVNLPENAEVEIVLPNSPTEDDARLDAVYEVLRERFHSGQHDLAERHNEHNP